MTHELIGKKFKCTCEGFEDCIGTIVHAWDESEDDWTVTYMSVKGNNFRGAFNFSEGELL